MKKLIIIPTIVLLFFFNQVALAVPKVSAEREADYLYGLNVWQEESKPYSYILETINDADSQELVRVGYELCDRLIEMSIEENVIIGELIKDGLEGEDNVAKYYSQFAQVALTNLCPYVK